MTTSAAILEKYTDKITLLIVVLFMKNLKNIFKKHDGSINVQAVATSVSIFLAIALLVNNFAFGVTGIDNLFLYPALIVFLGDRIGILFDNMNTSNYIMKNTETINNNIKNSSGILKFDTFSDAVQSIYRDIGSASIVTNLLVGDRDGEIALGAKRLRPEQLYRKFLLGPNSSEWRDIVGISEIYNERYLQLDLRRTRARITIKILRHSPPIINFIILQYPSKNGIRNFREVYFGWIGDVSASETYFYSCDLDVVMLFESECRSLSTIYGWTDDEFDAKLVPDGSGSKVDVTSGIDLVDKAGWWITQSRNGNKIERYAVFKVGFKGTGARIRGRIYDSDKADLNPMHHTKSISHYKDRIHFEYTEQNNIDGKIKGTCGYQFHFIGDEPSLTGFVTRNDDQVKREIYGYKIPHKYWPKDTDDLKGMKNALNSEFTKISKVQR